MEVEKTPVSKLIEIMVKRKFIPNFELICSPCATFQSFTYRVTCDGLVSTGTGRSKRDAKHEAAKAMLAQIAIQDDKTDSAKNPLKRSLPEEGTVSPKKARDIPELNAAGTLINVCSKHYSVIPGYQVEDTGPSHAKIFTITCTVSSLKTVGVAKTKKDAKNEASRKMLAKVYDDISKKDKQFVTKELKFDDGSVFVMKEEKICLPKIVAEVLPKPVPIKTESAPNKIQSVPLKTEIVQKVEIVQEKAQPAAVKVETLQQKLPSVPAKKPEIIQSTPVSTPTRMTRNGTLAAKTLAAKTLTPKTLAPESAAKNNQSLDSNTTLQKIAQIQRVDVIKKLDAAIKTKKLSQMDENTRNLNDNNTPDQNSPLLKAEQKKGSSLAASGEYMKKSCDEETRCKALKEVNNLIKHINEADSDASKAFVTELKQNFISILKPLNFTYKKMQLETKSTKCVVLVEISKDPDINEIGVAECLHHAELNGIKQILQTLTKILMV